MSLLYRFKIERWEQSSRVENKHGDFIGFVDTTPRTTEQIYDLMHAAYEQGLVDGKKEKAVQVRKILGI